MTSQQINPQIILACDYLERYGLSGDSMMTLLEHSTDGITVSNFRKDDTVFSRNAFAKALGVIIEGTLVSHKSIAGGTLALRNLECGDIFGLAALFGEAHGYVSTVYAKSRATVVFFSEDFLKKLFNKYPEYAIAYIRLLSQKIRYLNTKIDNFATPNAYSKLALYLYEHQGYEGSMSSLADILGMSRMTLYRNLDLLVEEGTILKNGKKITLINADIAVLFQAHDGL